MHDGIRVYIRLSRNHELSTDEDLTQLAYDWKNLVLALWQLFAGKTDGLSFVAVLPNSGLMHHGDTRSSYIDFEILVTRLGNKPETVRIRFAPSIISEMAKMISRQLRAYFQEKQDQARNELLASEAILAALPTTDKE